MISTGILKSLTLQRYMTRDFNIKTAGFLNVSSDYAEVENTLKLQAEIKQQSVHYCLYSHFSTLFTMQPQKIFLLGIFISQVLQYNQDEYVVLVYIILQTNGQMNLFSVQIQSKRLKTYVNCKQCAINRRNSWLKWNTLMQKPFEIHKEVYECLIFQQRHNSIKEIASGPRKFFVTELFLKEYRIDIVFLHSVTTRDETVNLTAVRKFVSKLAESSKRRKVVKPRFL